MSWAWIVWPLLLITQNFAFTMVSRARNSKSIPYHAIAALCSNGIWFASQFLLIDLMVTIIKTSDWFLLTAGGLVYILATMTGSLTSHWFLMKYIEPKVEKTVSKVEQKVEDKEHKKKVDRRFMSFWLAP